MTVYEAIRARRSVGKMKPDRPPREKIEHILEAATYAPDHHTVEPWRFFVISGKAREELGELFARRCSERLPEIASEKAQTLLAKERGKLLQAPVVIVVASVKPALPKVLDIENVEAVAAAIQNMLLTAQEEGLASIWRTGEVSYDPEVKAFFGLEPEEHLVGFIYLGYPAITVSPREPGSFEARTRWLGWEE
ncbi:MAG: nitroreductase [Chloroflexota bacterium]|nr:nitroreductase [Chloroflexota bacterium]